MHRPSLNKSVRFAAIATAFILVSGDINAQAAASLSAGCAKNDQIRVHAFPGTILNIVTDVMEAKGFFAKHCLSATRVVMLTAPVAFSGTVNGDVNFVNLAVDNGLVARTNGLKVKIVAGIMPRTVLSLFISKAVPLPHLQQGYPAVMNDLVDKKIGVTAIGTSTAAAARANYVAAGLDPNRATYIGIGATPAMLAALSQNSVDAIQMYGEGQDVAEAMGLGIIVGDLRQPGGNVAPIIKALDGTSVVWWAQESYINNNGDVVRRFVRANAEAVAWAKDPANFEELATLMDKMEPLPADLPNRDAVNRKRVRIYANNVSERVDDAALRGWNAFAIYAGEIKEPLQLDDIVWRDRAK